jgi:hypothetical protein
MFFYLKFFTHTCLPGVSQFEVLLSSVFVFTFFSRRLRIALELSEPGRCFLLLVSLATIARSLGSTRDNVVVVVVVEANTYKVLRAIEKERVEPCWMGTDSNH